MRIHLIAGFAFAASSVASAQNAPPKFRLVEDLRIDGAALDISGIGAMVLRPGGGVVIVEPQDFRLRFFDGAGKEIAKFGRRGEGPGEFSMGNQISPISAPAELGLLGDTIWAYNARRFALISADARLARTVPHPDKLPGGGGRGGALPEAGPNRVVLDFRPMAMVRGSYALGTARWGRMTAERRIENSESGFAVASDAGEITRVLAMIPPENASFISVRTDASGSSVGAAVPFVEQVYRSVSKDGSRVAIGVTTITSDKQAALRIVVVGSKVPPRVAPAVADELESKLRAAMPKWTSVYRSIGFGADNSIWVSLPTTPAGRDYLLLDERANPIATVVVSKGMGLSPGLSTRNVVWGVVSDADDLPSIVRYRVVPLTSERRGAQGFRVRTMTRYRVTR